MAPHVDYTDVVVNKPEQTCDFLQAQMGFFRYNEQNGDEKPTSSSLLIGNEFGDKFRLWDASIRGKSRPQKRQSILIRTNDCLRDYYHLGRAGVRFKSKPVYTAKGLSFSFLDTSGNSFMVLEQRDYLED
ncbi:MAG TPA: VOC family protein [Mucilaginibacter sp.]|nr:VOC family protein [Mucilaginibacter sp.]